MRKLNDDLLKGRNGAFDICIEALRYLAENTRPTGGQERFNAEHLHQISDEVTSSIHDLRMAIQPPPTADIDFDEIMEDAIKKYVAHHNILSEIAMNLAKASAAADDTTSLELALKTAQENCDYAKRIMINSVIAARMPKDEPETVPLAPTAGR